MFIENLGISQNFLGFCLTVMKKCGLFVTHCLQNLSFRATHFLNHHVTIKYLHKHSKYKGLSCHPTKEKEETPNPNQPIKVP